MNGAITYNGNNLQTDNIITNSINHTDLPSKNSGMYGVANADRSAIPFVEYPSRSITIAGVIKGDDQDDLDLRVDQFKQYFNGIDNDLDINYAGSTRRYKATANGISVTRTGALEFAPFEVQMICTDPFGADITPTEITNTLAHSSPNFTITTTIEGSAPYQLPVFTITLNTITGSGDYVQLTNDNNGQEMLLYGLNLQDGDVIVIDCEQRKVTYNDVEIDYTGVFLELDTGDASVTYADGFATRSVDIHAEYIKRYL